MSIMKASRKLKINWFLWLYDDLGFATDDPVQFYTNNYDRYSFINFNLLK